MSSGVSLCGSMPALMLTVLVMVSGDELLAQEDVLTVIRSGDGDIVEVCSSEGSYFNESCASGDFTTYMVEDKECVNDTTLSCDVRLVPRFPDTFTTSSISSFIADDGSLMVLNSNTNEYGVGIAYRSFIRQTSTGSCMITGLEVIRGRGNITTISHSGFSVVSSYYNIAINVNSDDLPYERTDYHGEVYRMDINCTNRLIDCVYFKLNGTTDLTKAKFNSTLLATTSSNSCTTTPPPTTASTSTSPSINTTTTNHKARDDIILRYNIIIGAGFGSGFIICFISVTCTGVCCRFHGMKSQRNIGEPETRREKPSHALRDEKGEVYDKIITDKKPPPQSYTHEHMAAERKVVSDEMYDDVDTVKMSSMAHRSNDYTKPRRDENDGMYDDIISMEMSCMDPPPRCTHDYNMANEGHVTRNDEELYDDIISMEYVFAA